MDTEDGWRELVKAYNEGRQSQTDRMTTKPDLLNKLDAVEKKVDKLLSILQYGM